MGAKEYGMDHLDLFKPETYQFADDLFKEYLKGDDPVFVGKRVHIGTDEYSNAKKEVVEKIPGFHRPLYPAGRRLWQTSRDMGGSHSC